MLFLKWVGKQFFRVFSKHWVFTTRQSLRYNTGNDHLKPSAERSEMRYLKEHFPGKLKVIFKLRF